MVTLVTCHPYGINTHRLLVQGTRIPYEVALAQQVQEDVPQETSVWEKEYYKAILICLAIFIPLTVTVVLLVSRRRKQADKELTAEMTDPD